MLLMSCDATLRMTYIVENKSNSDIKLLIPNFPTDSIFNAYSPQKDTIIILKPTQKVMIGSLEKIDFPWTTKKIYKTNPGICGIQLIENQSTKIIDCSSKTWKYKNRYSKLSIKNISKY